MEGSTTMLIYEDSSRIPGYKGQNYKEINDRGSGSGATLWDDDTFLPRIPENAQWIRPSSLTQKVYFTDLDQGSWADVKHKELHNCWLTAAMSVLPVYRKVFDWVVPKDQVYSDPEEQGQALSKTYAGIFHFRIFQGTWVDVCVDDRIPYLDGVPAYNMGTNPYEFWVPLLEKAVAKLHGSYDNFADSGLGDGLMLFTGGLSELFPLRDNTPSGFQEYILSAHDTQTCPMILGLSKAVAEGSYDKSLYKNHAYAVLDVRRVGNEMLLHLRNPWGFYEWTGAWSDLSTTNWTDELLKELGHKLNAGDGSFWMSYNDVINNFSHLAICHMNPDTFMNADYQKDKKRSWTRVVFTNRWVRGVTAGGDEGKYLWRNPQYQMRVWNGNCPVIIALFQKTLTLKAPYHIGFFIYNLSKSAKDPWVLTPDMTIRQRQVIHRQILEPGTYAIVPCTSYRNQEAEFVLRVFLGGENASVDVFDDRIAAKNMNTTETELLVGGISPSHKEKAKTVFNDIAKGNREISWLDLKSGIGRFFSGEDGHSVTNSITNTIKNIFSSLFPSSSDESPDSFSKDMCRSMLAMLDQNRSGTLSFDEFEKLWAQISGSKSIYDKFKDNTDNHINATDLKEALSSSGYTLNKQILNILTQRYADDEGRINFNDFVMCSIHLQITTDYFKGKSATDDKVTIGVDEYVEKLLYS